MARIRTIKPEMWDSEKLGRCSALARLNFVGLISLADDEGRGRGGPRLLFGRLHAYAEDVDQAKCFKGFEELEKVGLVRFYEVDRCRYYLIPGWDHNQKIEKAKLSKLPAPIDGEISLLDKSTNRERRVGDESLKEEGHAGEGVGPARRQRGVGPRTKDQGSGIKDQEGSEQIASLWNDTAHKNLARVGTITEKRKDLLRKRWKENPNSEYWVKVIKAINASAFLIGERKGSTWRANLDWLIRNQENTVKVLEGEYADKADQSTRCVKCKERPNRGGSSKLCKECAVCAFCGTNVGVFKLEKRPDKTIRAVCQGCQNKKSTGTKDPVKAGQVLSGRG